MTTLDLDAIEARANAARPAPWSWVVSENRHWCLLLADPGTAEEGRIGKLADDDDSEFIAHARTDVPALVAEVRRLSQPYDFATSASVGAPTMGVHIDESGNVGTWWGGRDTNKHRTLASVLRMIADDLTEDLS
jgi:hypothetical protein